MIRPTGRQTWRLGSATNTGTASFGTSLQRISTNRGEYNSQRIPSFWLGRRSTRSALALLEQLLLHLTVSALRTYLPLHKVLS